MGLIICNKHGEQSMITPIEKKLAEEMDNGVIMPEKDVTIVTTTISTENGEVMSKCRNLIYKATFNEYRLKLAYDDRIKSDLPHIYFMDKIANSGMCEACYQEYRESVDWSLEDPGY